MVADPHFSLAGAQLAAGQFHQRRLAGAVGAEQAGDARPDAATDVVDADHRSVELRHMVEGEKHLASPGRERGCSTAVGLSERNARDAAMLLLDDIHGAHAPRPTPPGTARR